MGTAARGSARGGRLQLLRVLLPACLGLVVLGLAVTIGRLEARNRSPYPVVPTPLYSPVLASQLALMADPALDLHGVQLAVETRLRRGETLSQMLAELGLDPAEAHAASQALAEHVDLRQLRPDYGYRAFYDGQGRLASFEVLLPGEGRAVLTREGGWASSWQPFARSVEIRSLEGSLEGSLIASIERAGGQETLAYQMARVLQWDLDFTRDLRHGDRFEVLYEEVYLDDQLHGPGDILALAYENRGRRLEAYRFDQRPGYYDAEGRPLRKLFLRSPLEFSRVTSRFSHRRFHPVLKTYRPHYGVDYGAPVGTPVRVTANGVVSFAGWDRGGGRTVKVRHPNGYLTAYLHLSRFAKGVAPGRRVDQGEVIGYVGATGLATGPHLDYRVQHRGRWIDPLAIKSVPAEPIPAGEMAEFLAWRDTLREKLRGGGEPAVRWARAGDRSAPAEVDAARR